LTADLPEAELGGGEEGAAHENREDGVARHIVAVDDVDRAARVVRKHVGVVESYADEEHGDRPAEGAEHSLAAVARHVVVQVTQRGGVGHRDCRCAQKLAHYLQIRKKKVSKK